ncbi:MAG TPA: phenylalanine--tRNA ligase subunit alpha, partial [Chromatiaceae bacterium]|nr:phenylalanine--tRNA ligase subunit alpha [Chromatiaceae bacterium]
MSAESGLGIAALQAQALNEIAAARDLTALDRVRVTYLGKAGLLTAQLKQLGRLPPEERPGAGQA